MVVHVVPIWIRWQQQKPFFCFVCKTLKLSGVSGGVPSAFPPKNVLPMCQECSASCNGAQKRTREIARYSAYGGATKNSMGGCSGSHTWSILIYYEYHDDCVGDINIQDLCILYMHITIISYNYFIDICHLCLDGRQAFPAMAPLQRHKGAFAALIGGFSLFLRDQNRTWWNTQLTVWLDGFSLFLSY